MMAAFKLQMAIPIIKKPMRKLFLFACLFSVLHTSAQTLRLNFMAGLSNYYGEIQKKKLTFDQSNPVIALGATLDLTNKLLLRSDFSLTKLQGDDKRGRFSYRNLNFKTSIREATLLLEYNLFNLNEKKITPYVFSGVGLFNFNSYTTDSLNRKVYLKGLSTEGQGFPEYPDRKLKKSTQINLPIGGGLKYAISDDVQFGFEYGLRVLFTDYLDDISKTFVDPTILRNRAGQLAVDLSYRADELKNEPQTYPTAGSLRGSPRINDLYYYGLARLSIRMNWFENGMSTGRKSRLGCPSRVL